MLLGFRADIILFYHKLSNLSSFAAKIAFHITSIYFWFKFSPSFVFPCLVLSSYSLLLSMSVTAIMVFFLVKHCWMKYIIDKQGLHNQNFMHDASMTAYLSPVPVKLLLFSLCLNLAWTSFFTIFGDGQRSAKTDLCAPLIFLPIPKPLQRHFWCLFKTPPDQPSQNYIFSSRAQQLHKPSHWRTKHSVIF